MLSLALAAAASLPAPQSFCNFETQVEVTGFISSVSAVPAAPLDTIATGDSVRIVLSFINDASCSPAVYTNGYFIIPECSTLDVGGIEVDMPAAVPTPCLWGEEPGPGFSPPIAVSADAPFHAGAFRFSLEMQDPLQDVGIGISQLAQNGLDVTSVVSSQFSISARLLDPSGGELAAIEVLRIDASLGGNVLNYCDANPNSSGEIGRMGVTGSLALQDNDITLTASQLPPGVFAFFLNSKDQGFFPNPGGSAGNLCLSDRIGRYVGPGQILVASPQGTVELPIDLTQMPTPGGLYAAVPGDTWNFQLWFRDVTAQGSSNFTDGISIPF